MNNDEPLFKDEDEPVIPAADEQPAIVAGVGSSALGSVDIEPEADHDADVADEEVDRP